MNYRHAFHAGSFADVLKHAVLVLALRHLAKKDTPFRVIDTHAGPGLYPLDRGEAARTGEWRDGIGRLIGPDAEPLPVKAAAVLQPYLDIVAAENPAGALRVYPGSPRIARALLRRGDRLVANELLPEAADRLGKLFDGDRRSKIMTLDGWTAIKSLLPPKERRGLVLVDPPFEEPGELIRLTTGLADALERFRTGTVILWYPIKDEKPVQRFHRAVAEVAAAAGIETLLAIEIMVRPARNPDVLNGTGLVIANPPFTLAADLEALLPALADRLAHAPGGGFRIAHLAATTRALPARGRHGNP